MIPNIGFGVLNSRIEVLKRDFISILATAVSSLEEDYEKSLFTRGSFWKDSYFLSIGSLVDA